ncbi:MAG TPA: ADOP family duplicated permease [Vicinamibacterales bacterium]|nr:ADOP family duplicated permease [Vicinamibacterales bacterium]
MNSLLQRLRSRFRNRGFDQDLRDELRVHEEMKREELAAAGLSASDARTEARRALGNVTLMRENSRAVWMASWLDSTLQDVRYAIRTLLRQPVHSLTAGTVLVLAIGLNASLFTVFKGIFLEPWPVQDPGRVVRIWARTGGRAVGPSVDEYRFIRQNATSFSGLVAHTAAGEGARLESPGRAEAYLPAVWVSAGFFDVLGARMQLGAGFIEEDDLPGNRRAPLVISDSTWRAHFGADPGVVGRPVSVTGQPFTIAGVLKPDFDGIGRPVDMWMPLSAYSSVRSGDNIAWEGPNAASCCVNMVGRLAAGANRRQAAQELQLLHERFSKTTQRGTSGRIELFGTREMSGPGQKGLGLLAAFGAAVALILVLACANVGNLQLARGLARRREIATRMSLGASRRRVVRQLLTEGLVLACAAGGLGFGVSAILPPVILRFAGEEIPAYMAARLTPDGGILLFTLGICVASCLAFALAPAFQATRVTIPLGVLDRASTRPSRFHLRSVLLATQIAVCTVLLAGAGLVTRAIAHAMSIDPGFTIEGVDVVSTSLPTGASSRDRQALIRGVLAAVERDGGDPVAVAPFGPINDARYMMPMALPHKSPRDFVTVLRRSVSARYFDVLGIPFVNGRMFPSGVKDEAVVNEAFVRAYWPDENPIGRQTPEVDVKGQVRRTYAIVGVVRDTYLTGLERIDPVIFTPDDVGPFLTRGGPAAVERIRATALAINPAAIVTVRPLRENVRKYLEESRTGAALAWAIGLLGLILATVGVFGVFAYAVEERRREIGLRLALGAARTQIVSMLLSSSGRAMLFGLGAGLLLSLGCGPVLRSYLYGLSPVDPVAYGMVTLLLATAASLATLIPARRACRVDPAVTLRED